MSEAARQIMASRRELRLEALAGKQEVEGGCGVIGLACTIPIKGKYIEKALIQMHNRGNGKGGGIAAVGLNAAQLGVSKEILENDYLIQIAYLDPNVREAVEKEFIYSNLEVDRSEESASIKDHKQVGLEVMPPLVWRYFCRVKKEVLAKFIEEKNLKNLSWQEAEDEFIFQNSFNLNRKFYFKDKKAFVLCHGKNLLIFKIVGYAEQAMKFYKLDEIEAHIWIGHQRYPTKGKIWHPGGAHPFIGLNAALVHNGDFANYHAMCEYLKQRNTYPLFFTDTEVAVLLFDLYTRVYNYPLEYAIEALAPTIERDFELIPVEKQRIYKAIQKAHIHASPDGPWFFIIARNHCECKALQLIGITDTSMLRPQVFALQERRGIKIGLIASEKQAIDAVLRSLARDNSSFAAYADRYWNARGGSYSDGGAFIFTLQNGNLICTDKFGKHISSAEQLGNGGKIQLSNSVEKMEKAAAIQMLTQQLDFRGKKRGEILAELEEALYSVLRSVSPPNYHVCSDRNLPSCREKSQVLVIDAEGFPSEGEDSLSRFIVKAYNLGWKKFIIFNLEGQRFLGCGLGANSSGVRIDVYGSSGDYLASGLDGGEIYVHGDAQDQVANIFKSGKLVIYGNVGQAFMYGAKGGEVYVLGNAAGRPLINAVGKPRVVINGTA